MEAASGNAFAPVVASPRCTPKADPRPPSAAPAPALVSLCFAAVTRALEPCAPPSARALLDEARARLPTELKERLFDYFCDTIIPATPPHPLPQTAYPEDRYRDVQLVNRITCQRVIPLCFAMWSSLDYCYEKVRRLVEEEICDVNESDLDGFCPLHYAAIYSRVEACKLLLRYGADCNKRNNYKKTPLDIAQDWRIQQMIRLRSTLFTTEELELMQAETKRRRKEIAKLQRQRMKEEFVFESAHLGSVLARQARSPRSGPSASPPQAETPQADTHQDVTRFHNNDL
eukprot:m51a1_g5768 putative serine threonine protein kinase (287) ;mRNA; r:1238293-1239712